MRILTYKRHDFVTPLLLGLSLVAGAVAAALLPGITILSGVESWRIYKGKYHDA